MKLKFKVDKPHEYFVSFSSKTEWCEKRDLHKVLSHCGDNRLFLFQLEILGIQTHTSLYVG